MSSSRSEPATARPAAASGPHIDLPTAREQFIPLRKADLVERLASSAELSPADAQRFRQFCALVQASIHHEFHRTLEALKDAYAPFDPDADTRPGAELSPGELDARRQTLFERFDWLLERGNFVRLAEREINQALADRSQWGLNLAVDFEIFDRLELYCRGDVVVERSRRRLVKGFRTEAVAVPMYRRLVLIFHLRPLSEISEYLDTQGVHIKLFKDIPKADLEMLLPGTSVRMSLVDQAKIMLPTLSGVSIATWKIVQSAFIVAAAGFYSSLAFLSLIGGTVGYGIRSFFGYLNTKQKYQLNLTQSLYYQNLDNNAGTLYRLVDEAEEQENRETILAYYYLWRMRPAEGWSGDELDGQVESRLRVEAGSDVDFEVADALAKLQRMGLADSSSDGKWKAVSIDQAIVTLKSRWATLPL